MLKYLWNLIKTYKKSIFMAIVGLLAGLIIFYQYNHHPDEIEIYQALATTQIPPVTNRPLATGAKPRLQVTWLGVSGFLIQFDGDAILIDPFASRASLTQVGWREKIKNNHRLIRQWFKTYNMATVRGVFVSHSHYDHSMDAPVFARLAEARLYGSESTLNIGRGHQLAEEQLRLIRHGQMFSFGKLTVLVLESKHGPALFGRIPYPGIIDQPLLQPAPAHAYRLGKTYSFFITYPGGGKLLHHASADRLEHTLRGIRADRILLGIAGRANTKDYLRRVALPVKPRQIIPMHFDNFFAPVDFAQPEMLWNIWLADFMETTRAMTEAQLIFFPLGKTVSLPD